MSTNTNMVKTSSSTVKVIADSTDKEETLNTDSWFSGGIISWASNCCPSTGTLFDSPNPLFNNNITFER